ncbi:hypothetical protein MKW98_009298 [Papaver atlanticum]|uniref:Uncharacterized protein n=1 Tax=Papaver atlanticum TaxID=357466 RepID=A0AAD4SD60_9MAGN|nr:hypothetical protein MKW98_009298 [Papaver atlanticum]
MEISWRNLLLKITQLPVLYFLRMDLNIRSSLGEFRCSAETPTTDIAMAFKIPGGWQAEQESMQLTVLQFLMGGGGSFSQGGPRERDVLTIISRCPN